MTQNVKRTILTTAVLLCMLAVRAQTTSAIIGQWKDEKEPDRQMEFYLDKDGLYYAKTINSSTMKPPKHLKAPCLRPMPTWN
jgi:hypothetical protein